MGISQSINSFEIGLLQKDINELSKIKNADLKLNVGGLGSWNLDNNLLSSLGGMDSSDINFRLVKSGNEIFLRRFS